MDTFERQLRMMVQSVLLPADKPVSLEDLLMSILYKTTGEAYFGLQYNVTTFQQDWKTFDELVSKVALGYPPLFLKDYVRCRERIVHQFAQYVEADPPHQPCELLETQLEIGKKLGWNSNDLGRLILANWWQFMASAPWGALYVVHCFVKGRLLTLQHPPRMLLILQLQRPEGFGPIIEELDQAGAAFEDANKDIVGPYSDNLAAFFDSRPSLPLLNASYAEMLRYSTDSYSMREVMADETTLGGYTLKKGERLICGTRAVHTDGKEYKSPGRFIPKRHLAQDGCEMNLEGNMKWMPFGGGPASCPGNTLSLLPA